MIGNGIIFFTKVLAIIRLFTDFGSALCHAYLLVPGHYAPDSIFTYLGKLGIYCSEPNVFAALDGGYKIVSGTVV